MTEILVPVLVAGLLAGFIFSMPIAGPISILITSNALKGRRRFCNRANFGAAIADAFYVFIAVFGLTKLYSLYKPLVPYLLALGALFIFRVGYKIVRTPIDIQHLDDEGRMSERAHIDQTGGFRTGFMLNFLNPTLFLGWLTSSCLVISLVAALGFNTGGLDAALDRNVKELNGGHGQELKFERVPSYLHLKSVDPQEEARRAAPPITRSKYFFVALSFCYALALAAGSVIWFYLLAWFLTKHRQRINVHRVSLVIQGLGAVLCVFGLFFGYTAARLFLAGHWPTAGS